MPQLSRPRIHHFGSIRVALGLDLFTTATGSGTPLGNKVPSSASGSAPFASAGAGPIQTSGVVDDCSLRQLAPTSTIQPPRELLNVRILNRGFVALLAFMLSAGLVLAFLPTPPLAVIFPACDRASTIVAHEEDTLLMHTVRSGLVCPASVRGSVCISAGLTTPPMSCPSHPERTVPSLRLEKHRRYSSGMAYVSEIWCLSRELGLPVDHVTNFGRERAERSILRGGPSARQPAAPFGRASLPQTGEPRAPNGPEDTSLIAIWWSKQQRSFVRKFLLIQGDAELLASYFVQSWIFKGRVNNAPTGAPALPLRTPHALSPSLSGRWWLRPDSETQVIIREHPASRRTSRAIFSETQVTIKYVQRADGCVERKKLQCVQFSSTQHPEPLNAVQSKRLPVVQLPTRVVPARKTCANRLRSR